MSAALPRSSIAAGIEANEHVRRAAEVARHRQAVGPTNMSAALPRSSVTAGPPRGSAVEVERHRGAAAPTNMSAAFGGVGLTNMSGALPRSSVTAGRWAAEGARHRGG